MELSEWLGTREDKDPRALAREIIRDHQNWALQMIADRILSVRRNVVRALEHQVAASVKLGITRLSPTALPTPKLQHFHTLLQKEFALGDGTRASWGDATIEQHQKRIAMLSRKRDGLSATIRLHEGAIRALQQSGVPCLSAIFSARAATPDQELVGADI